MGSRARIPATRACWCSATDSIRVHVCIDINRRVWSCSYRAAFKTNDTIICNVGDLKTCTLNCPPTMRSCSRLHRADTNCVENHQNQSHNLYQCAALELIEVCLHHDTNLSILKHAAFIFYFRDYLGHCFIFVIKYGTFSIS